MRAHLQCSTDPGVASTSYAHLSAAGVCSAPSWRRRRAGPPRGNAARCFAAAAHAPHTAKAALRTAIEYTRRGSLTSKDARGQIEEAQTAVEALSPPELDYDLLPGKWRLVYTTAPDVLPILGLDALPLPQGVPNPLRIGDIYQRFSSVSEGRVENIIHFGTEPFLKQAVLTVVAGYEVRSPKRIALTFLEAQFGQLSISPLAEALLAPAVLPRGDLSMRLLQGVQDFGIKVPFRSAQQLAAGRAVGASYLLTYLDGDMLIGRASSPSGTFIFQRAE